MMGQERGFQGLEFYQASLRLVKAAYALAELFPERERYNLAAQLRRAVVSVPLNIAEGYGRYHYLDRLRFLYIARGSLNETVSAFDIAVTLGYCASEQGAGASELAEEIEKNLNGYCRFIRNQQQGKAEYGGMQFHNESTTYDISEP